MELLMVMGLLGVLASLTLVVGQSIAERSKVSRAKAELAVLASALEHYKQQFGDFPWTPEGSGRPLDEFGTSLQPEEVLFNALCGNLGPRAAAARTTKARCLIETARFALRSSEAADLPNLPGDPGDPAGTALKRNALLDPWGNAYRYVYRKADAATDTEWLSVGFLLYSAGPDGLENLGGPGLGAASDPYRRGYLENFPAGTEEVNLDNIYHNEN